MLFYKNMMMDFKLNVSLIINDKKLIRGKHKF